MDNFGGFCVQEKKTLEVFMHDVFAENIVWL